MIPMAWAAVGSEVPAWVAAPSNCSCRALALPSTERMSACRTQAMAEKMSRFIPSQRDASGEPSYITSADRSRPVVRSVAAQLTCPSRSWCIPIARPSSSRSVASTSHVVPSHGR